jgi:hypothetical protein
MNKLPEGQDAVDRQLDLEQERKSFSVQHPRARDNDSNGDSHGRRMKLMSDTDTMTVLQFEPTVASATSCNGLTSNDMSVSLPNLAGNIDVLQDLCTAGSSSDIRNGLGLAEKRGSCSGLSEKQQFKTLSLEDCQTCIKNTWNINGYATTTYSDSSPSHSQHVCKGIVQVQDNKPDDLSVNLNPTNNRLSAVLENISLVYLPQTKQLVPAGKNAPDSCPDLGSINNNVETDMVRDGPEGAENPCTALSTSTIKHFPRLEAKLDSGPSLSPSFDLNSSSSITDPTFSSTILGEESDIATHSTVILCKNGDDEAQDVQPAQGNFPQKNVDILHHIADVQTSFHSKADGSSFSSISSLSTGTELSISAASCSDLESAEKVIVDSEEAGFVEISLDARSISEQKLAQRNSSKDIAIEERLPHLFTSHHASHPTNGAKPKRKGLTSFLTR